MSIRRLILGGLLLSAVPVANATSQAHWIFFAPRPEADVERAISPLAAERLHRLGLEPGSADQPVWEPYVAALREMGIRPRVRSRYFHAVSAMLADAQVKKVIALPFVASVTPVRCLGLPPERLDVHAQPIPDAGPNPVALSDSLEVDSESYGLSLGQLAMLGIPDLHAQGLSGEGVRIAILDSGFQKDHPTLAGATIAGERDIVYGDDNVQNDDAGDSHGTCTFSALGGRKSGLLIGSAYGATFLLARTEEITWERAIEEDYYVAGLEWADSMGAAIVSASLGYKDFPDDEEPWAYGPDSLDGQTAITTRGVNWAAERGILVVAAAGNEGPEERSLLVPADSDLALTVGAVYPWGEVADFSSRGPTADGRIKPDVTAQGVSVLCGSRYGPITAWAQGTSLAAPLIAGLAALLIEAQPTLGPDELISAIRASATHAENPNSANGYGIPWGPTALAPAEASLVIDSLKWSVPPTQYQRQNLEVRLHNIGMSTSEPIAFGPAWPSMSFYVSGQPVAVPALAPGETHWTGPWDTWSASGYFTSCGNWARATFAIEGDGITRLRVVSFPLEWRPLLDPTGFQTIEPSPWVGNTEVRITFVGWGDISPVIDLLDVSGRLRGSFQPLYEPDYHIGALRLVPSDLPEIGSGKYFLRLRGGDFANPTTPILIIR